ncbi:ABC transporter permease [Parvibaculum sp.]|jgi:lipoprotein-releasing system permease protein|uniref:ABC transporter permease n=1 Tax=Parvibaculum sp. TaxID=2024848 RepID=UPI000C562217|nr:ABC transporter permease [Parvibaculum sp.]MAM94119.1 ABC transporter [Parvibaculum sp.]HCX68149.1 ABC transporter permease [Rhodobiaceae bacterium]|tara:strand:+ start:16724 stop:17974 length:1251 start_codon:yes stop_codon:yes gene_type:complete
MFWQVAFSIAAAQLTYRRRQTVVSMLGVALGVGFFIAASAVMSGSEKDLVRQLVENAPHITIKDEFRTAAKQPVYIAYPDAAVSLENTKPREYLRGIKNYGAIVDELSKQAGMVAEAALTGQAIIRYASKDVGASIAGIDPEKERLLTTVEEDMREGSLMRLKTSSQGIVIGQGMSDRLGLRMDDLATVVSPTGLVRRMKVVGIFRTGNLLLDEGQVYMLLKDAQVLLEKPFIANRIRIKVGNPDDAEDVAARIESRWGYRSESWQEVNRDFLGLFVTRNIITYSIVSAIMVVASFGIFNIISTIVMEKRRDIAILISMGFRAFDVQVIFLVQGIVVGLLGMAMGWCIGYILLEMLASVQITIPGMTEKQGIALERGIFQYGMGGLFAVLSAVGAAWYPARKASQVRPVDIIRGAA